MNRFFTRFYAIQLDTFNKKKTFIRENFGISILKILQVLDVKNPKNIFKKCLSVCTSVTL